MTNENDSDSPPTDPNSQPSLQPPMKPPAPLQATLPYNGKRKADETKNEADELAKEFRAAEKWVIGTNIILAIIGIVALCIYYGQLEVMRGQLGEIIKQYPEIQKSANASVKAADQTEKAVRDASDNFKIDQRPWVAARFAFANLPVNPMGLANSPLTVTNIGKTQATDVRIEAAAVVVEKTQKQIPFKEYTGMSVSIGVFFPNMPRNYGTPIVRDLKNGKWGGVEWNDVLPEIRNQNAYIFGYINVWYHDAFSKTTHRSKFCELLEGEGKGATIKTGMPPSTDLANQCNLYNRAYDE